MINIENITVSVSQNPYNVRITSQFTTGSDIVEFDLKASNGVVQKVDRVFLPKFYRTTLNQLINQFNDFSITASLINSVPSVLARLSKDGSYTLLAPTNKAWQALGTTKLEALQDPDNIDELKSILRYHILPIVLPNIQFRNQEYTTLQGSNVTVTIQNSNTILFNNVQVIQVNALARNGIGHGIQGVLSIP